MSKGPDLSADKVGTPTSYRSGNSENADYRARIEEERQRRFFKSYVLWGLIAILIILFCGLICLIWKILEVFPNNIDPLAVGFFGLYGAFTSLLGVNLIKMVSNGEVKPDWESHPVIVTLKELAETVIDSLNKK